jgi:hypothetical protein
MPKKTKKKVGRPTVFTPDVIRKIEEVAALDGSVEEMAYYANINRATLYSKLEDDKEFSDKIAHLRERPVLKARQTVVKSLDDPNHAFKYLERKRKKEFGNNIDLTSDGEKVTFNVIGEVAAKYVPHSSTDTDRPEH